MRLLLNFTLFVIASIHAAYACECGQEGSASRIFKGSKTQAHKFPWIAHIRAFKNRNTGTFGQCGGSLIDPTHIATAAHCVVDDYNRIYQVSSIDVFLGRVRSMSERSTPERVSSVWVDPRYNSEDLSHDFAILTLSKPVQYTKTVGPVCLPNSENGLNKLTVSGWGLTKADGETSDELLDVDVSYMNRAECNSVKIDYLLKMNGLPKSMKSRVRVPEVAVTHMCAINKSTMGDACSGDSGGPLMHKGSNGRHYLMGVVSGSWTECGQDTDSAGLYTRVAYYKDIIQTIAPNACWADLA